MADLLSPRGAEVWDTAVLYQLVHALALLLTGILARDDTNRIRILAGWAFGIGVLLFSGSLYVLALDGPRIFGPITPLGGLCFIFGWLALAASTLTRPAA